MAGGTWTSQNKVRPGVYIRFASGEDYRMTIGERGTVAIYNPVNWGPVGKVFEVTPNMDTTALLGAPISKINFLREMFKGSNRTDPPKKVLLYRANTGTAASARIGNINVDALYPGKLGNDITIQVIANTDDTYTVNTIYGGVVRDSQTVAVCRELVDNDWVSLGGPAVAPTQATAGTNLSGGVNAAGTPADHAAFLTAIEPYHFDVIALDLLDADICAAYIAFVKRLAEENGQYTQLVCATSSGLTSTVNPDSRFVIDVATPVRVDGTFYQTSHAVWWVAGATAGAQYNQSLTYAKYPGATPYQHYTNDEIISGINNGKFLLVSDDQDGVRVETDINTLTTYTQDIGKVYHKNRVMRLCNTLANDVYQQFSDNFIGVVTNNEAGRERLKAAIVGYMLQLQAGEGIRDFNPRDVEVLPGEDIDAVVVNLSFYALDAVEKIYMTVTVS